MTLDTTIYVYDEIDHTAVFHKCRELLRADDRHSFKDDGGWRGDGARCLSNGIAQGLPAWLMVDYRPNAPLRPETTYCTDCGPDEGCETRCSKLATYLEVSFDTAYSYSDEQGRGCGDLHACYVADLGQWLDARGIAWSWQNEFTGEIHGGDDRYARLTDLTKSGADATAWFSSIVQPAITQHIRDGR